MGTQKIALDIDINTSDGAKSLKELKQEFKELNSSISGLKEGSEEYYATLKKIANTKDEIDDLNESIAAQTGAGKFQAIANIGTQIAAGFSLAQGAMALFGTESKEVEKALLKVQAAQAILQGFKELEGAADALKNAKDAISAMGQGIMNYIKGLEGATAAQKIFNLIASLNPVGIIITAVAALAAGLVILAKNYQTVSDENKELRSEMEKSNAAINDQIKANESLIRMLDGVYGSEKKLANLKKENLELQKQQTRAQFEQAAREYADAQTKLKAFEEQNGLLDKLTGGVNLVKQKLAQQVADSGRELTRLAEQNKALQEQTINERKKEEGEIKRKADELAKNHKKEEETYEEKLKRKLERLKNEQLAEEAAIASLKERDDAVLANKEFIATQEANIARNKEAAIIQASLDRYEKEKKLEEERLKYRKDVANAIMGIEQQVFSAADSLTKLVTNNIEKQKKAEKVFAVSKLAIDTAKAISGAVAQAQSVPFPANLAAIATGVATVLANMAQAKAILSRVDGGGDIGGGGNFSGGGFSGNGATFTPSLNNSVGNTSTILSNLNNPTNQNTPPVKVYVTETDISNSINQVNKIKTKALIE